MTRPLVALVGRPNVGKSTLFNRLAGAPLAIVHDAPGVTRDRHYADAPLHGREITWIDTGGFDPGSDDPMRQGIARHVKAAIQEADLVVCVLDATAPPTPADREAVRLLRRSRRPHLFVANKVDNPARELDAQALHELGIGELHCISAAHGRGLGPLAARLVALLPPAGDPDEAEPEPGERPPRVVLFGRPNAGKSSLLNRLAGEERALVDDRPGTTRDPVDAAVRFQGKDYVLVDTAGIRRRPRVDEGIEEVSVMRALRALERCDVAVLMVDARLGLAAQDQRLLGLAVERGRALVVGMNKVDGMSRKDREAALQNAAEALAFARWVPLLPCSAASGAGVPELMRQVWQAADEHRRRVTTGELNRFFEEILERNPPPTHQGRAPRVYYVTQASTAPPVFVVKCSHPDHVKESYQRFVQNQLRQRFGFRSVPLVVRWRPR